jgi:predicted chitinase/uncharacterized protein GlcG (DUF336 family)
VNVETLMAAMPGLDRSTATAYLPHNDAAMSEFQITNANRAWMWLAQVGHESLSLRYLEEIASGAAYEGRKDLGNTQPGDGKKYKGRGPIQITGRANYTNAANALKLDLVNNPAMAAQPQHAFRVSAWWWFAHGLNGISDTGDVTAATRRINGGLNGLSDRQSRYARAKGLGPTAVLPSGGGGGAAAVETGVNMVASAVADDGNLHTFAAMPDALFYAWQRADSSAWSGGAPGKSVAKFAAFARAPSGRKITAVSACKAAGGALHVFARLDDGSTVYTYQAPGSTAWSGGKAGESVAGLSAFAPPP